LLHKRRLQRAATAAPRGLSADLLLRRAALHDSVYFRQKTEACHVVVAAKGGQAKQLPRQVLQATQQRRLLAEGQARRVLAESEPGALRGESGSRLLYDFSIHSTPRLDSLFLNYSNYF